MKQAQKCPVGKAFGVDAFDAGHQNEQKVGFEYYQSGNNDQDKGWDPNTTATEKTEVFDDMGDIARGAGDKNNKLGGADPLYKSLKML